MMNKAVLTGCVALLCAGAAFGGMLSQDPGELTVAGQYWIPGDGDFDLFDGGYGASLSYREWFSFPWGASVNLGLAQWQVNGGSDAFKYEALSAYDGDVLLVPFGASLCFNMIDWDSWNLILDTGVQYLFVDSSASVFSADDNRRHDVDIGGAVLWNIGAEFEYMVAENIYLLGGIGYQVDIARADTEYDEYTARDTSFRGASFRLGAKYLF